MARGRPDGDHSLMFSQVELRGLEPLTPCLQSDVSVRPRGADLARQLSGSRLEIPLRTPANGTLTARDLGLGDQKRSSAVTRLWAWCTNPIPPKARRDAVCCSVRCRQARHRFLRAVGSADLVAPGWPLRLPTRTWR